MRASEEEGWLEHELLVGIREARDPPGLDNVRLCATRNADEHLHQEDRRGIVRRRSRRRSDSSDRGRSSTTAVGALLRSGLGRQASICEILERSDGRQECSGFQSPVAQKAFLESQERPAPIYNLEQDTYMI